MTLYERHEGTLGGFPLLILCEDKQQQLITGKVSSYCCLPLHCSMEADFLYVIAVSWIRCYVFYIIQRRIS